MEVMRLVLPSKHKGSHGGAGRRALLRMHSISGCCTIGAAEPSLQMTADPGTLSNLLQAWYEL